MNSDDGIVLEKVSAKLSESKTLGAAIILALDEVMSSNGVLDSAKTQVYIRNNFIGKGTLKHGNFLFGASINPKRKDAFLEFARVKKKGTPLIKWIPSIMDFDPADSALIPFYLALKATGLPLVTHTDSENSFVGAKDSLCDPIRLELHLSLGFTVMAVHVGTPGKSHEFSVDRNLVSLPVLLFLPNSIWKIVRGCS